MNISELKGKLGRYSERGHEILEAYRDISSVNVPPRRFRGEEMRRLAGVSATNIIYTAEANGRLPKPDLTETNRKKGATLAQMNTMRELFDTSPSRKSDEPPVVLSFTNFKGGCWKTTTSLYAGSYWANQGYRVLLVDLDPQASLTQQVGILPDIETNHSTSLGPYIMNESSTLPASSIVMDTYCENMKIVTSTLELAGVEFALSNEIFMAREQGVQANEMMKYWFFRVRETLEELKGDYDIVIVDGTPSVGLLPINIIFGADSIVVPVPTEAVDYASTIAFTDLLYDQLETIEDVFGIGDEPMPTPFFLPTRFEPSDKTAPISSQLILENIRDTFETDTLTRVIKKHRVVSNLAPWKRTIFDVNAGDLGINRESRKRAMENYSAVFDETMYKAIYPHWKSKEALLQNQGVY